MDFLLANGVRRSKEKKCCMVLNGDKGWLKGEAKWQWKEGEGPNCHLCMENKRRMRN